MKCHAVLSFESLLTHGALKGLLVRMRQLVPVEVVNVTECLSAYVARVVLIGWWFAWRIHRVSTDTGTTTASPWGGSRYGLTVWWWLGVARVGVPRGGVAYG